MNMQPRLPSRRSIPALLMVAVISLNGCGGGGGSGSTAQGASCSPSTLGAGSSLTLSPGTQVLVPGGSSVSAPGGTIIDITGSNDTIQTVPGSVVTVPAGDSGAANNLVSTGIPSGCGAAVSANAVVLAGSATSNLNPVDGTGTAAILWGGGHLAMLPSGNLVFSDRGVLRQVTLAGAVTTLTQAASGDFEGIAVVASSATVFGMGGGPLSTPPLWGANLIAYQGGAVQALATDWESAPNNPGIGFGGLGADAAGNLYYADGPNNRIVKFDTSGAWTVLAGNGTSGSKDGKGLAATLDNPTDLAIDAQGKIFFLDRTHAPVRRVTPDGTVETLAYLGSADAPATGAIAVDPQDNVYVAGASRIIRMGVDGSISDISVPTTDLITSMTADSAGNIYLGTRGVGAQIIKVPL